MQKQNYLITIILIILFTAAGFFGGTKYQQSKILSPRSQFGDRMQAGGNNNGQVNRARMGGGQIVGDISAQDKKTITIKLQDGSSKIILLSEKTTINKASQGLVSDLKVGEKVAVFGTINTDGSVTAQNIQLNPMVRNPNTTPPVQP